MEKLLQELGSDKFTPESNPFYEGLEFNDLREYIKAKSKEKAGQIGSNLDEKKIGLIDKMNLEDLKLYFEAEHRR
jgi:hypothetical protein